MLLAWSLHSTRRLLTSHTSFFYFIVPHHSKKPDIQWCLTLQTNFTLFYFHINDRIHTYVICIYWLYISEAGPHSHFNGGLLLGVPQHKCCSRTNVLAGMDIPYIHSVTLWYPAQVSFFWQQRFKDLRVHHGFEPRWNLWWGFFGVVSSPWFMKWLNQTQSYPTWPTQLFFMVIY